MISMNRTSLKILTWHKIIQCAVVNAHILQKEMFKLNRKDDNFTLLKFMENLKEEIFTTCSKDSTLKKIDDEEVDEALDLKSGSINH